MHRNLYIIQDKVANMSMGGLIRVENDEVARRAFHDALNAKEGPYSAHPGDYKLLRLGTIDETTGIIEPQQIITTIADGQDWVDANKDK